MRAFVFILTCLLALPAAYGRTIYVDANAPGADNGTSWENAYNFLQDALADTKSGARPAEIRVAQGIYKPDRSSSDPNGTGDREATFQLINDVILKGGYAGLAATEPNTRNIRLYKTILTGDLNGDDVELSDPCDLLTHASRAENSWHVLWGETEGTAALDGVTVTGGNANYGTNEHRGGGGMLNLTGSPVVANCTFTRNSASSIGGALVMRPAGLVVNCTFSDNWAYQGGAIWSDLPGISVNNCTFVRNLATNAGGIHLILAISATSDLSMFRSQATIGNTGYNIPILRNCILHANKDKNGTHEFAQLDWSPRWSEFRNIVAYSCIQGWSGGGTGNINVDPCFVDPNQDDYHLKSQAGRWDPNSQAWIIDNVTSPCIDRGNPMSPIGHEPFPNGGIINMGAYGGTAEASKSYFGKPPCEVIVAGDINGDCEVNFLDFRLMALHWLENNNP